MVNAKRTNGNSQLISALLHHQISMTNKIMAIIREREESYNHLNLRKLVFAILNWIRHSLA